MFCDRIRPENQVASQSEEKTGRALDSYNDGRWTCDSVQRDTGATARVESRNHIVKQELQLQLLRKAPVFAQVNMPNVKGTELFFCQRSSCNLNRIQGAFSDIRSGL